MELLLQSGLAKIYILVDGIIVGESTIHRFLNHERYYSGVPPWHHSSRNGGIVDPGVPYIWRG
jgi:hypothetical protein